MPTDWQSEAAVTMADKVTFLQIKDLKRITKILTWKKWQDEHNSQEVFIKNIEQSVMPRSFTSNLSRRDNVAITHLRNGHTRLTHGFYLIGRCRPLCEMW